MLLARHPLICRHNAAAHHARSRVPKVHLLSVRSLRSASTAVAVRATLAAAEVHVLDQLQAPSSITELDTQGKELLSALKQLWPDNDVPNAAAIRIQLSAMALLLREEELCLDSSELASIIHEQLGDVGIFVHARFFAINYNRFGKDPMRRLLCSTGFISSEDVFVEGEWHHMACLDVEAALQQLTDEQWLQQLQQYTAKAKQVLAAASAVWPSDSEDAQVRAKHLTVTELLKQPGLPVGTACIGEARLGFLSSALPAYFEGMPLRTCLGISNFARFLEEDPFDCFLVQRGDRGNSLVQLDGAALLHYAKRLGLLGNWEPILGSSSSSSSSSGSSTCSKQMQLTLLPAVSVQARPPYCVTLPAS